MSSEKRDIITASVGGRVDRKPRTLTMSKMSVGMNENSTGQGLDQGLGLPKHLTFFSTESPFPLRMTNLRPITLMQESWGLHDHATQSPRWDTLPLT